MKKILFVPIILGLLLLTLSHEDVEGNEPSRDTKVIIQQETPIKKELSQVYNSNYDEINKSNENNFSVTIGRDRNISRDSNESFVAQINNANNIESCNYFWKKDGEEVNFGKTVELTFSKGEHTVFVNVVCGNQEANATITVNAWDYYMITREHFDAYYGDVQYIEREIENHLHQYLLIDDGIYMKERFFYNESHKVERVETSYYNHPEQDTITYFTYTPEGLKSSEKTYNAKNELSSLEKYSYNQEGILISLLSGTNEEDLTEQIVDYSEYETNDNNTEVLYIPEEIKSRRELNDEGLVIYEEYSSSSTKTVDEYRYDEENRIVEEKSSYISKDRTRIFKTIYNKDENIISRESKLSFENFVGCEYRTEYTYNENGVIKSKVDILLGGECPYINEVKRVYTYDKEGNVKSIHADLDNGEEMGYATLKISKVYTNEIEDY